MRRRVTDEEMKQGKFFWLRPLEKEERRKNGRSKIWWKCQCECGKTVWRRESSLVDGNTQSCGCRHSCRVHGSRHPHFRGCGEIGSSYFALLRCGAKNRGIEFGITIEHVWDLFLSQDRKCVLTGLSLCFASQRQRKKGVEQTASLDRIDSTKGYVPGNVQWVHKDVNMMKKEYDQDRFIEVCKLVAQNAA